MLRTLLTSAAIVLSSIAALGVSTAQGGQPVAPGRSAGVDPLRSANYLYGPYATIRRANEVANIARRLGFYAIVFHNGDGYYVRAWR